MKFIIEGKEYGIRYSLRMYYTYEGISGTMFIGGSVLSVSLLFYSALLAGNDDFPYGFDRFVDILDENESLFADFNKWLFAELGKRTSAEDKKKVPRKKR